MIALNGAKVKEVTSQEGTILRQKVEDDCLKLTISYDSQPQTLADLTFEGDTDKNVKVQEIMLGTAEGKEVYPDLVNDYSGQGESSDSEYKELQKKIEQLTEELNQIKEAAKAEKEKAEQEKKEAQEKQAEASSAQEKAETVAENEQEQNPESDLENIERCKRL